jgi:hypothetical protein
LKAVNDCIAGFLSIWSAGDALQFDRYRRRQAADLHGRAARTLGGKIFCIYGVVRGEVPFDIGQVDRDVDEVVPFGTGAFENGTDIGEDGMTLLADIVSAKIFCSSLRLNRGFHLRFWASCASKTFARSMFIGVV